MTRPSWRTPIDRPGSHSVISIWSVSRIGPTAVTHSNRVPTPRVWSVVKRMISASAIQSTCDSIGSRTRHTSAGGASYVGADPDDASHGADALARRPDARSVSAASSGGVTLIITPVPRSNPAAVTRLGHRWTCQWYWPECSCGAVWKPRL